jgi:hypothetical protein
MPAPGVRQTHERKSATWKATVPASGFAAFAQARYLYASAWNVCGSGPDRTNPGTGLRPFRYLSVHLVETVGAPFPKQPPSTICLTIPSRLSVKLQPSRHFA